MSQLCSRASTLARVLVAVWLFLGGPLTSRSRADASAAPSAPKAEAEGGRSPTVARTKLVNEGLALRRKGDDKGALERFEAALKLGRDARVLAQIAMAEEALGRWAKSYAHLKEALSDVEHKWIVSNRPLLEAELKKIEAEIGTLEVGVNVAGAEIALDGEVIGSAPLREPIITNPGTVVLTVQAAGFVTVTRPLAVTAGGLTRAEVALTAVAPPPVVMERVVKPVVVERRPEKPRYKRNPAWLYAASGAAAIAIASVGPWLRAGMLTDGMKKDCMDTNGCSGKTFDHTRDKVAALDMATNVMLFSGIGLAVLGVGAYFLFPEREKQPDVRAHAFVTPTSFGLAASGKFGGL